MEKRLKGKSILLLILMLSMNIPTFAADTFPISVSCTIPAVPGLNVPPYQNESAKVPDKETQIQAAAEEASPVILKESQKTIQLADGSTCLTVTKTIYSR